MLTLALALSLAVSPSTHGARLLGDQEQPLGSATLLAQSDLPPPPPSQQYQAQPQGETLQSLRAQYAELERSKPRIGGWIAMMAVGTPVSALFTYFTVSLIFGGVGGLFGLGTVLVVFTGIVAVIGFAAAVVGTIMLIVMAVKGGKIGDQMEELRQRIDVLERSQPPTPPPGYYYPPPPPPPPPAVERERPADRPLITLATF